MHIAGYSFAMEPALTTERFNWTDYKDVFTLLKPFKIQVKSQISLCYDFFEHLINTLP